AAHGGVDLELRPKHQLLLREEGRLVVYEENLFAQSGCLDGDSAAPTNPVGQIGKNRGELYSRRPIAAARRSWKITKASAAPPTADPPPAGRCGRRACG